MLSSKGCAQTKRAAREPLQIDIAVPHQIGSNTIECPLMQ